MNYNGNDIDKLKDYISVLQSQVKKYRFDALTNLPGRKDFNESLEYHAKSNHYFALYLIDLNGLKEINDNHSYEAGDDFLKKVAKEINLMSGRVYRIGGDEFSLISYEDNPPSYPISTDDYCVGLSQFNESKNAKEYFKEAERMLKKEKMEYYKSRGLERRK